MTMSSFSIVFHLVFDAIPGASYSIVHKSVSSRGVAQCDPDIHTDDAVMTGVVVVVSRGSQA
jgi:hypothetical protein